MNGSFIYYQQDQSSLVGLLNLGNTCFVNASLQCLFNLKLLKDILLADSSPELNPSSQHRGEIWKVIKETCRKFSLSKTAYACTVFLAAMIKHWREYERGQQQDCFDFLSFLLYAMHEDVKENEEVLEEDVDMSDTSILDQMKNSWRKRSMSPITFLFTLQLVTVTVCYGSNCSYKSINVENSPILSLEIPGSSASTLQDCLSKFNGEVNVPDFLCSACGESGMTGTKRYLGRIPPHVIIHLKRFQQEGMAFTKNEAFIDFPINIDLYGCVVPGVQTNSKFTLTGVIHHSGSLFGGHYWCYCRKEKRWYECNDSKITRVTARRVASKSSYILIYERNESASTTDFEESTTYFLEKYVRQPSSQQERLAQPQDNMCNIRKKGGGVDTPPSVTTPTPCLKINDVSAVQISGGEEFYRLNGHCDEELRGVSVVGPSAIVTSTPARFESEQTKTSPHRDETPSAELLVAVHAGEPNLTELSTPGHFVSAQYEISPSLLAETSCKEAAMSVPASESKPTITSARSQFGSSQYEISVSQETETSCIEGPSMIGNFNLDVIDPVLQEADVPGSSLAKDPSLCTVPTLQRWLQVRNLPTFGQKKDLVQRVRKHQERGKGGKLDPGCDKGKWHEMKRKATMELTEEHCPPEIPSNAKAWLPFPSVHIPEGFNEDCILKYFENIPQCAYSYTAGVISAGPTLSLLNSDGESDSDEESGQENTASGYSFQDLCRRGFMKCITKGQTFLSSGRVLSVIDTHNQNLYFVKGQVQASMEQRLYVVDLVLFRTNGSICYAKCGCKAQALNRCGHIAAVLYLMLQHVTSHGYEAVTTTGRQCYWKKAAKAKDPGLLTKQYPSKRDRKMRLKFDPQPSAFRTCGVLSKEDSLQLKDDLNSLAGCLFSLHLGNPSAERPPSRASDIDLSKVARKCSRILWKMNVKCSKVRIPFEVPYTAGQSQSKKWFKERAKRCTASEARTLLGLTSERAKINFLRKSVWGMDRFESEAMKYGKEFESKAREDYATELSTIGGVIITTGLFVNPKFPQLACSPDGLILLPYCPEPILLEIKVLTKPNINPKLFDTQMDSKERKSFYLKRNDEGYVELKRSHQHYYQIQMSLDILELQWGHLVVWSESGYEVVPVSYCTEFWIEKRLRLIKIHRELVLPEIVLKRAKRRMVPIELEYTPFHEEADDPYFRNTK